MTLGQTFSNAWAGWSAIFSGKSDAVRHFDTSPAGINMASTVYLAIAFGLALLQMTLAGFLGPGPAIALVGSFLAPLASLLAITGAFRAARLTTVETVALVVPGLFLLSAFLLLSSLFALIGLNLGGAVLGLLAVFLYRLARVAGMMTMGRAVAYAVLILLVLVGVTQAVYMASSQFFPSS